MMLATSSARQRSLMGHASEKRSLASILREHGPLSVMDAVDIALDVCDVLTNAHVHGVVHGDLGLHRVRCSWPRVPGQRVDLFALDENDSAAFSFRASAAAILIAPEQRDGRAVDIRADVWAVGALLYWMIAGVQPSSMPIEDTALARAPRALLIAIEACLADDPSLRPQSVDELAEVIGSFASSPPDRFEALARRRAAIENAKGVRTDLADVDRVLGRLDDAALARELVAAAAPASSADPGIERLMFAVQRTTGAAFAARTGAEPSHAVGSQTATKSLVDDDENVETVLAQPRYEAGESFEPVVSPLTTTPPSVLLASELLAPPKEPEPAPVPVLAAPASVARTTKPWTIVLGVVGAIAALSLGVGIGMRVVEHALSRAAAPAASIGPGAVAAPPAARPVSTASDGATISPASSTSSPIAVPSNVETVLTPASLPDARLPTPASLPDAKRVVTAPRPKASGDENVPKGFKPFDSTASAAD
jgi:eukaryotic-like serine/threonine-protein kinase